MPVPVTSSPGGCVTWLEDQFYDFTACPAHLIADVKRVKMIGGEGGGLFSLLRGLLSLELTMQQRLYTNLHPNKFPVVIKNLHSTMIRS